MEEEGRYKEWGEEAWPDLQFSLRDTTYLRGPIHHWGHIKNIHLLRCKHKTVKLTLTLTLTLIDTGGAVLTLMLGYRRLRRRKLTN